jgi:hypothetical protein
MSSREGPRTYRPTRQRLELRKGDDELAALRQWAPGLGWDRLTRRTADQSLSSSSSCSSSWCRSRSLAASRSRPLVRSCSGWPPGRLPGPSSPLRTWSRLGSPLSRSCIKRWCRLGLIFPVRPTRFALARSRVTASSAPPGPSLDRPRTRARPRQPPRSARPSARVRDRGEARHPPQPDGTPRYRRAAVPLCMEWHDG